MGYGAESKNLILEENKKKRIKNTDKLTILRRKFVKIESYGTM